MEGEDITTRMLPPTNKLLALADLFDPQETEGRKLDYLAAIGVSELLKGIVNEIVEITSKLDEEAKAKE